MQPLFRDVTDHVRRVQEDIDSLREVLAFAFEASLMAGQAQQNAITRKLAAWAAILAVPTAVAGIYGMNFEHMPELKWPTATTSCSAGSLTLCGLLYSASERLRLALRQDLGGWSSMTVPRISPAANSSSSVHRRERLRWIALIGPRASLRAHHLERAGCARSNDP